MCLVPVVLWTPVNLPFSAICILKQISNTNIPKNSKSFCELKKNLYTLRILGVTALESTFQMSKEVQVSIVKFPHLAISEDGISPLPLFPGLGTHLLT